MKKKLINIVKVGLIVAIAILAVVFGPSACTRPDLATRTLEQQGYTDVVITGWRPMMAGQDDSCSTGFEAVSPNGNYVTGAVTSGFFFKGATIRFD